MPPFTSYDMRSRRKESPIEDLSSVDANSYANPYDALLRPEIRALKPEVPDYYDGEVTAVYEKHRDTRNADMKRRVLAANFEGFTIDPYLSRLLFSVRNPDQPEYVDPRNSLVFWARPSHWHREFAIRMQAALKKVMPSLWLTPPGDMHLTVFEVAHSASKDHIKQLSDQLEPIISLLIDLPFTMGGCRLFRPKLCFDTSGVALTYLPHVPGINSVKSDHYQPTIHHLRRELYQRMTDHGVPIASRYFAPTAHITLARFVSEHTPDNPSPSTDPQFLKCTKEEVRLFVETIDELNKQMKRANPWQIHSLVCRAGPVWYGGGWTLQGGPTVPTQTTQQYSQYSKRVTSRQKRAQSQEAQMARQLQAQESERPNGQDDLGMGVNDDQVQIDAADEADNREVLEAIGLMMGALSVYRSQQAVVAPRVLVRQSQAEGGQERHDLEVAKSGDFETETDAAVNRGANGEVEPFEDLPAFLRKRRG